MLTIRKGAGFVFIKVQFPAPTGSVTFRFFFFDTYGLLRATHSRLYTSLRSVLNACHWHAAPSPQFKNPGHSQVARVSFRILSGIRQRRTFTA